MCEIVHALHCFALAFTKVLCNLGRHLIFGRKFCTRLLLLQLFGRHVGCYHNAVDFQNQVGSVVTVVSATVLTVSEGKCCTLLKHKFSDLCFLLRVVAAFGVDACTFHRSADSGGQVVPICFGTDPIGNLYLYGPVDSGNFDGSAGIVCALVVVCPITAFGIVFETVGTFGNKRIVACVSPLDVNRFEKFVKLLSLSVFSDNHFFATSCFAFATISVAVSL